MIDIPHRAPFLFVKGNVQRETRPNGRLCARVDADFPSDNPYVVGDDGAVDRLIVLEALAQAMAACASLDYETTQLGVLAMVRSAEFLSDVLPAEPVALTVEHHRTFGKLIWYHASASVERAGAMVVCCRAEIVAAHLGDQPKPSQKVTP